MLKKKKETHLLYGTSTIIYSLVGLALLTEKEVPCNHSKYQFMQICLRVIQVIFSDYINVKKLRERNIGPKQIHI